MLIKPQEIHLWTTELSLTPAQESAGFLLLSASEQERALQFRFPIHKQRFIATHSVLRHIISFYTNVPAKEIVFAYSKDEKPHLATNPQHLQFNLSHSDNMAIFAFTIDQPIGVDIEKIQDTHNPGIAKRFFSEKEISELALYPDQERAVVFYRIWARKEAIVKGIGKGISFGLSNFSVSSKAINETISVDKKSWSLFPLDIHPDYQAAVATAQPIQQISYWQLSEQIPTLEKMYIVE